MRGNKNNWKGGRYVRSDGYVNIFKPDHPRASKTHPYVPEHILVVEKMLGRSLKYYGSHHKDNEIPHHIDCNKSNNNPKNLFVCNRSENAKIHLKYGNETGTLFNLGIIKFNKLKREYYLIHNQ